MNITQKKSNYVLFKDLQAGDLFSNECNEIFIKLDKLYTLNSDYKNVFHLGSDSLRYFAAEINVKKLDFELTIKS